MRRREDRDTRRLWWVCIVLLPEKTRSIGGDAVKTERRQRRRRQDRDNLRPWWVSTLLLAKKTREDGRSWWVLILLLKEMTRADGGDAVGSTRVFVLGGGFRSVVGSDRWWVSILPL
ncbi:hypothetical protein Bca101_025948 [Brassica carinata]